MQTVICCFLQFDLKINSKYIQRKTQQTTTIYYDYTNGLERSQTSQTTTANGAN